MLMDSFYFFIFFIRVYLIYHVVFQVSSKVTQLYIYMYLDFPLSSVVKESPCDEGDCVQYLGWEDMLRGTCQASPVFLPGESHGQRSLAGYSP